MLIFKNHYKIKTIYEDNERGCDMDNSDNHFGLKKVLIL